MSSIPSTPDPTACATALLRDALAGLIETLEHADELPEDAVPLAVDYARAVLQLDGPDTQAQQEFRLTAEMLGQAIVIVDWAHVRLFGTTRYPEGLAPTDTQVLTAFEELELIIVDGVTKRGDE